MDVVEDSARREALAQRMSKLLGLPITNIQLLMPLITKEDLERLESLPDDQFLSQATKIINAAQKKQFAEQEGGDESPDSPPAEPAAPPPPPPPDASNEPKTLKRKTLGRKSDDTEAKSDAAEKDDVGPAVGESQTGVKVVDSSAAEMPAAFKRPVQKESAFKDKKVVIALVAGGLGALILVVLAVIFVFSIVGQADDPLEAAAPVRPQSQDETPATPAEVVYLNESAMKLTDTFYLEVGLPELTGAVTAEFWVRPLDGVGKQEVLVTGEGGGEETFRLIFRRQPNGIYEGEFAVPVARREAAIFTFEDSVVGKWVHLAGVYDPDNTGNIYLFAGGRLVAEAPTAAVPDLVTSSYRLISTVSSETEGFLVDEVRLTDAPRYVSDFSPERFFDVLSDTSSMLHLEAWEDGMVMDAAADNRKIEVPAGIEFVALADAPVFRIELAPIAFPQPLLDRMLEVSGQEYVDSFLAEWEAKGRAERIEYLQEIGLPAHVIEEYISPTPQAE